MPASGRTAYLPDRQPDTPKATSPVPHSHRKRQRPSGGVAPTKASAPYESPPLRSALLSGRSNSSSANHEIVVLLNAATLLHRQSDILVLMTPGELISLVRQRNGLSQAELAARAGTSQPVISAYEHGRRDPSTQTLRRLIAAGGEQLLLSVSASSSDLPPPVTPREHGERLVDLLLLADAVGTTARPPRAKLGFPRIATA